MTNNKSKSKANIYLILWSSMNKMSILFLGKRVNMHQIFVFNRFLSGDVSKFIRGKITHFPCWSITSHWCCIFVLLGISSYLVSYPCISPLQDINAKMLTVSLRIMEISGDTPEKKKEKQDIDLLELYYDNANTYRKTCLLKLFLKIEVLNLKILLRMTLITL